MAPKPEPEASTSAAAPLPPGNDGLRGPIVRGDINSLTPEQHNYVVKQQRWLVFLRHCSKCKAPPNQCQTYKQNCTVAKQLWDHILQCHNSECKYPRCSSSRELLKHHQKCNAPDCLICVPVRQAINKQKVQQHQVRGTRGALWF